MSNDLNEKNDKFWEEKWPNLVKALDEAVLPLVDQYKDAVGYLYENREDIGVHSAILPYMQEVDSVFKCFGIELEDNFGDIESDKKDV